MLFFLFDFFLFTTYLSLDCLRVYPIMSYPADYGRCLSEVAKANAVTQDISYVSETTTDTETGSTWDHTESLVCYAHVMYVLLYE